MHSGAFRTTLIFRVRCGLNCIIFDLDTPSRVLRKSGSYNTDHLVEFSISKQKAGAVIKIQISEFCSAEVTFWTFFSPVFILHIFHGSSSGKFSWGYFQTYLYPLWISVLTSPHKFYGGENTEAQSFDAVWQSYWQDCFSQHVCMLTPMGISYWPSGNNYIFL